MQSNIKWTPRSESMCIWRGQTFQICPPRTNTNPNMTRKSHSAKIGNTFHPIDAAQCCIVEYSIHLKFFAASLHSFPSILGFYVGCMRHRTTESPIIHFYDFGYWAGSSSPSWSGQNHFWESAQKQPPIVPPHRLCKVCAIFNRQANTISASVGQFGFNVSLNCGLLRLRMLWWWRWHLPSIVDPNILSWGESQFFSPFVHYVNLESIHCHHDHRLLSDFSDLSEVSFFQFSGRSKIFLQKTEMNPYVTMMRTPPNMLYVWQGWSLFTLTSIKSAIVWLVWMTLIPEDFLTLNGREWIWMPHFSPLSFTSCADFYHCLLLEKSTLGYVLLLLSVLFWWSHRSLKDMRRKPQKVLICQVSKRYG